MMTTKEYGPHKTIYNRFIRWIRLSVFNCIFAELAAKAGEPDTIKIDATHLKAYRTAPILLKGGLFPDVSGAPKAAWTRGSMRSAMAWADCSFCCSPRGTSTIAHRRSSSTEPSPTSRRRPTDWILKTQGLAPLGFTNR